MRRCMRAIPSQPFEKRTTSAPRAHLARETTRNHKRETPAAVPRHMTVRDVTDLYTEFGTDRLPPGQRRTEDFPVFTKDEVPDWDPDSWSFKVTGAVESERTFDWDEFRELPHETQRQDFHCVTGWSKFDCEFTGVPFPVIADLAGVRDDAKHVVFHALDGYTTDLPLAD